MARKDENPKFSVKNTGPNAAIPTPSSQPPAPAVSSGQSFPSPVMGFGFTLGYDVAPGMTSTADTNEAKHVLRQSAQSSAGRARITAVTPNAAEQAALTALTWSSDTVSVEDIRLFTGLSGYAADGSPTWGELVTALSS